jgi:hypothetical protein
VTFLSFALAVLVCSVLAAPAEAQFDRLLKGIPQLPQSEAPGDGKIGAGLKEALLVGTANAVSAIGQADGYFLNQAIKIILPDQLKSLERGLRAVGYGAQVDELVLSMNRAAERAAPAAREIFVDAIGEMTFDDARRILSGPDTAATDYFKSKTTEGLTAAFRPVIENSMNEVGVTRQYRDLVERAQAIPFLNLGSLDLDRYVLDKALAGLFHVVGDEERKIRTNPVARTTELLKDVFAGR